MCDYVPFDVTRLVSDDMLSSLEADFHCHPSLDSPLPVIFEDEVLKEDRPHLLLCFDYMFTMKRMLQFTSWLYEDALATTQLTMAATTTEALVEELEQTADLDATTRSTIAKNDAGPISLCI